MILSVFPYVGAKMSIVAAYTNLIAMYAGQPYPKKKAAGSLGGAVNGGTIVLNQSGYYIRVR